MKDEELGDVDEKTVVRKLNRSILVKFFVMTLLCYIDRTNLAFAALQLNEQLGFSEFVYGCGSSIFFIGYSLCQIPSNLMLVRFGAATWLSIIILVWGVVATAFAGMWTTTQFYTLRLLLGIAEAGTFPGMWYHMSQFYSEAELGVAYSYVTSGTALSQVFGAPLAAALLSLDGLLGLRGFQWLFIVEGLPTIFLGIWIRTCLAASPKSASFLTPSEAEWLHQRQQRAKLVRGSTHAVESGAWGAVCFWKTWYLAVVAMLEAMIKTSIIYWCPLIIASLVDSGMTGSQSSEPLPSRPLFGPLRAHTPALGVAFGEAAALPASGHAARGANEAVIALLTALPFGSAAFWMMICAKNSNATGEKRLHSTLPFLAASFALGATAYLIDFDPVSAFGTLLASTILWGPSGILSAMPATFLHGTAAATGVALINSVGNIGGLLGPLLIGWLKHQEGSYHLAFTILSLVSLLLAVLVYCLPMHDQASSHLPANKSSMSLQNLLRR